MHIDNIEAVVKEQAQIWMEQHIHGKTVVNAESAQAESVAQESLWQRLKALWLKV